MKQSSFFVEKFRDEMVQGKQYISEDSYLYLDEGYTILTSTMHICVNLKIILAVVTQHFFVHPKVSSLYHCDYFHFFSLKFF